MLQSVNVILLLHTLLSPIGSALALLAGAVIVVIAGRWVRRPDWLTGLALFFVAAAVWLYLGLRTEPVVPTYSRPWQPPLQTGTNLLWVGDGWNWYISGLILLLGGVGILLDLNNRDSVTGGGRRTASSLAIHLSVVAAGLLFVGSGNVLTAMLTWVVLDLFILVRGASQPVGEVEAGWTSPRVQAKGLSLLGALLLLIGLLPAGPTGPSQPLQGGTLPAETVALMLVAALIRAGIYPFHLWIMPGATQRVDVSEQLLDHMVPVLCGLWLLGWTVDLGAGYILLQPDILFVMMVCFLGSAVAGWTASNQANHTTFVLVTSAGLAALAGVLSFRQGPAALIWPTTAFALGGALWLVGEQVWQTWGWQIPVSVGALALAGAPFTPGFLTQPSLARLLDSGPVFLLLFAGLMLAQSIQVAAMLRSWSAQGSAGGQSLWSGHTLRLLAAVVGLAVPLAIVGFFPAPTASLAGLTDAIPPMLGSPPMVVADWPVWVALAVPLGLGITLVSHQPALWQQLGSWPTWLHRLARLEWLFSAAWWLANQASLGWGSAVRLIEGAGYMGWIVVLMLLVYLLVR